MDSDIRRRSACDRCHSQKLRCPKSQGATVCDRCAKAEVSCAYSPFRQKKDPENSQNGDKSPDDSHNHLLDGSAVEKIESRRDFRDLNPKKKKRIAPPTPKADLNPRFAFCGNPTQIVQENISDGPTADSCSNPLPAFHNLISESTSGNMDIEDQFEYPPLEFDLPSFPTFRDPVDKIHNLLKFPSPWPTTGRSLDNNQFERLVSPLPDMNTSPSHLAIAIHATPMQIWSGDVRKDPHSVNQCVRQLSDLSFRLYEHSITIPTTSVNDPVTDGQYLIDVMNARAQDYTKYKTDDTFRLTQELVDVYPSFIDIFTRRKISEATLSRYDPTPFDSENPDTHRPEILGSYSPSLSDPLALDHSSIFLIISCHLRLIEIYSELFKHMEVCIEQRGKSCKSQQGSFTAPTIRIGNYVPPATTAVPMQMILLLHFAKSLCDHAVELESHIREPKNRTKCSGSSPDGRKSDELAASSLVSAEKLKDRAVGMLNHLRFLRSLMLTDSIFG